MATQERISRPAATKHFPLPEKSPWRRGTAAAVALGCIAAAATGCASAPMNTPAVAIKTGDWKSAQKETAAEISQDKSSRRWMLSRMRAGVCALDAGDTQAALGDFADAYGIIRTQGLNADRTIPAYVINESVKIWKGEPFEQAMMLAYYGMLQAELNSWDNCRAACDNALFSLRDPDKTSNKPELDTAAVAAKSRAYEDARARGLSEEAAQAEAKKAGAGNGYLATPTDFALGHLLMAISAQQMKRPDEAADHFARVEQLRPDLAGDLAIFRANRYNAVLVVTYGLGPRKEAYAPNNDRGLFADKTCTRFAAQTDSESQLRLSVTPEGQATAGHLPAVDLNLMAMDHRWRDLEELRKVKSVIGNVATVAGGFVALDRLQHNKPEQALVGLGIAAVGLALKASTHAQTEYCDTFPQRAFVVPLWLDKPTIVNLDLPGRSKEHLIVTPPKQAEGEATLTYVRLPGF